jgi:hypothetical protein
MTTMTSAPQVPIVAPQPDDPEHETNPPDPQPEGDPETDPDTQGAP